MEGLRQNVASADRERAVWKQRDGELKPACILRQYYAAVSVPDLCKRASTARYVGLDGSGSMLDSPGVMPRTHPHEACTVVAAPRLTYPGGFFQHLGVSIGGV